MLNVRDNNEFLKTLGKKDVKFSNFSKLKQLTARFSVYSLEKKVELLIDYISELRPLLKETGEDNMCYLDVDLQNNYQIQILVNKGYKTIQLRKWYDNKKIMINLEFGIGSTHLRQKNIDIIMKHLEEIKDDGIQSFSFVLGTKRKLILMKRKILN